MFNWVWLCLNCACVVFAHVFYLCLFVIVCDCCVFVMCLSVFVVCLLLVTVVSLSLFVCVVFVRVCVVFVRGCMFLLCLFAIACACFVIGFVYL